MDIPSCLFADPASTECHAVVVDEAMPKITLQVTTTAATATCPKCHAPSCRVHSRYTRTLADLPWAGIPVRIELTARRFVCENPGCDRIIFTERLVQLAAPWARRTERLTRLQQQIGCSTGASCGSRLCTALGMPVGIDALLNLIRHVPTATPCELHIIGVDDWAKRKGQCYGTIIVDHERGDIVDLLPDRTPETLAAWLRQHPEIEVISRDRAEAYAQGIRDGAPTAIQVADRFHLLKNLSDALFRILQQHHAIIEARLKPTAPGTVSESALFFSAEATPTPEAQAKDTGVPVLAAATPSAAEQRRWTRMQQAHRMRDEGWTQAAIAEQIHMHPKSISRYLSAPLQSTPRRAARRSLLDPFKAYLRARWDAGCHNATRLMTEIVARGYRGRVTMVRDFVHQLRHHPSPLANKADRRASAALSESPPTLRCLAWCVTQPPEKLSCERAKAVAAIEGANDKLDGAIELSRQFAQLVRDRAPDRFDAWLEAAATSGISALRSFAQGLRRDYDAVKAALALPWSNGPTEGHITRLKCLKRAMYGRAKLDLLRLRLLTS